MSEYLLKAALGCAVPLHIDELQRLPWETVERLARDAASTVASKGDLILFRSGRKGETAAAFNALARGMAALSFAPGGVHALGLHFEAQHPELAKKPVGPSHEAKGAGVSSAGLGADLREGAERYHAACREHDELLGLPSRHATALDECTYSECARKRAVATRWTGRRDEG